MFIIGQRGQIIWKFLTDGSDFTGKFLTTATFKSLMADSTTEGSGKVQDIFTSQTNGQNDPLLRHQFEESASLDVYDQSWINLGPGCPGPDLLKALTPIFREATLHRMDAEDKDNHYLFQYGPTAGLWGLREALSKFLSKQYGQTVNRSDLILTCGATHGLHLVVSILLAPDAVIFVEEFTYMIALSLFKEFPAHRIVKVPMTPDGVDVEKFESIVTDTKKITPCEVSEQKPFWAMFYTIPNFQNPTGTLLPPDSCKTLVRIARQQDLLIVCDDVYNLLYYGDGVPPPRLFSYDDLHSADYTGGNVISNGSFSKIMAPGVRVGWAEMAPRHVKRFRQSGTLQSGGSVNNVMFGLMQSVIELGLAEKHLEWYKEVYKGRMQALCQSLKENLPSGCSYHEAKGGYFVWVQIPVESSKFLTWCRQMGGPGALPAVRFVPSDGEPPQNVPNAFRLSIGFHDAKTLTEAGKDLSLKLKIYLENNQGN